MNATCPNCGAAKNGEFCSVCGQNSRDYLRSALALCADFLAEVFDLHGRMLRSITTLLFRPGYLSSEFSRGRRANYVSPGRLYLFVSVLFFFVLSVFGEATINIGDLSEAREAAVKDPELRHNLERLPEADRERIRALLETRGVDAEPLLGPPDVPRAETPDAGSPAETAMREAALTFLEDPQPVLEDLIGNLPVGMFVMLPLFGLLLKGFYPRRFYAEHLVFALHLHAFLFLAFTALVLTPERPAVWRWLDSGINLACVAFIFLALKRFYGQSAAATAAKGIVLSLLYVAVVSVGIAAVFIVTVRLR